MTTTDEYIQQAYARAVVAIQQATGCTELQADAFVSSMADLIFTTMQTYLDEQNAPDHN